MFGSFAGMLNKLKQSKTVQSLAENISENYSKLKGQVLRTYEINEVLPQIYHIPFPEVANISQLKSHIGNNQFQVWNVGQYTYEANVEKELLSVPEQGEVNHLCFTMYSNLPFYQLILALNTIHRFTQGGKNHRAYVHCQDSRIRSALLFACYIYLYKLMGVEDISEAILFVNKELKVHLDQPQGKMHKNIHFLLKNFVNYLNNFHSINKHQLRLLKIIISNPPKLRVNGKIINEQMKVSIQIKCGETTALKTVYSSQIIQGNILCAPIDKKNTVLTDQFLLIVKFVTSGRAYNMLRIQHNTNFIYQCFTRVQQQDIDTSDFALMDPHNIMHVDFMFEETNELSKLANLEQGGLESEQQNKLIQQKTAESTSKEVSSLANQLMKQQTAKAEREQAHSQAIACLKEAVEDIVDEDSTTIDLVEEINQKLIQKSLPVVANQEKKEETNQQQEEEEQDLDDYLSKLESQA